MAEERDSQSREDLTEEASPYRIEEYRRKGIVAQSKEVTALFTLLAAGATAYWMAPGAGALMIDFMREVFQTDLSARLDLGDPGIGETLFFRGVRVLSAMALPICFAGFFAGVIGSFVQIGAVFSFEPLSPDLSRLDPIQGLQRMFSMKNAVEGLKMIFKTVVILLVAYYLIKTHILGAGLEVGAEIPTILQIFGDLSKVIFLTLILVLMIFAIADFAFQKYEFSKNLRMTKQEAKQEFREREGDPQIRARIRSIQRETARKRMMHAVKTADVVVTNPTHIAVAIVYDKSSMAAPKVVAKGADFVAQKIKQIAAEAGVPMVENVPLARTLYKSVKVGQFVPRALYQAVAEVLAYVYRLKKREL